MSQPWDAGKPVSARGRYYVPCPANAATTLQEREGALGDEIDWIWMDAGAGNVVLRDGGTIVRTFAGQAAERFIPLNLRSRVGAWSITTPVGITATAAGSFQ